MNLDRFSQGLPDAQEALPIGECIGCRSEIYPGDEVVEYITGKLAHKTRSCLLQAEGLGDESQTDLVCVGCREVLDSGEDLIRLEPDFYCHDDIECLIQARGAKTITAE